MQLTLSGFFDLGFETEFQTASAPSPPETLRGKVSEEPRGVELSGFAAIGLASIASWVSRTFPSILGHRVETPDQPLPASFPVWQFAIILLGGACVLGVLAWLLHFLRGRRNRLYWHLACWVLVVVGIVVRQMVANSSSTMALGVLLVSAVVGVAILPGLMRWLNKISKEPGLQHVAVPFSLGFFVDLAQVLASHYIVRLPWIPT
jgi:hypothetical protein